MKTKEIITSVVSSVLTSAGIFSFLAIAVYAPVLLSNHGLA